MSVIIYNASKIKSYENLKALCSMVGETSEFADFLWQGMLFDQELMEEFNYFVVNHTIKGKACCGELTLLDIYFNQMNKYNLCHDLGKNPIGCNKDRMVLHAFRDLLLMRKDPNYLSNYYKNEQNGMDISY